jgi:hypothetical protein
VPVSDSIDDFVWVCGPSEGFAIIVSLRDKAVDSSLKIDHASEDTALEPLLGKFGEESFDCSGPVGRLEGRLGEHHDTFSNIRS